MAVVLFGADGISETTVQSGRIVDWMLQSTDANTVIYSDDGSIFIFDFVGRELYKVIDVISPFLFSAYPVVKLCFYYGVFFFHLRVMTRLVKLEQAFLLRYFSTETR